MYTKSPKLNVNNLRKADSSLRFARGMTMHRECLIQAGVRKRQALEESGHAFFHNDHPVFCPGDFGFVLEQLQGFVDGLM